MGAVLIGGGYALLPLLEQEIVNRRKWAKSEEMLDFYALAQLLPGVIALNTSMLIGNRLCGLAGTLAAAAGLVAVPFVLIALYAALYGWMKDIAVFEGVLTAVQAAVAGMIAGLGWNMLRKSAKDGISIALATATTAVMLAFDPSFVWIVVFAFAVGIIWHLAVVWRHKEK